MTPAPVTVTKGTDVFTLPTLTLTARELEGIGDRLELLRRWFDAEHAAGTMPHDLRWVRRDCSEAADSIEAALGTVRDAIADQAAGLDASIERHPAGRRLAEDEDAGDQAAGEPSPEVSELASLAVSALVADPERTRSVLRDIAAAGVVEAPGEHVEATPEDAGDPSAVEADPEPVALDALATEADGLDALAAEDADALAGRPPAWWADAHPEWTRDPEPADGRRPDADSDPLAGRVPAPRAEDAPSRAGGYAGRHRADEGAES